MTVGWRDKEENAYDLTSISILYDKDYTNLHWECEDGYAEGSFSTCHFNEWTCQTHDGKNNITVEEWTANKGNETYRRPEINNCKLLEHSATERPPEYVSRSSAVPGDEASGGAASSYAEEVANDPYTIT